MSAESAFTPGPWEKHKEIGNWIMAGHLHVATIPRAADGDWSQANARLIAASPDLLEALEAVIAEADYKTVAYDKARAAIAKARGMK